MPFIYVCFTDEISIEDAAIRGLDVIPFSSAKVKNNKELWQNEIKRKDIKLPKNATCVWIDIYNTINTKIDFSRD